MEENISLEIAANLLHLTKDEDGEKKLDALKVATAIADAVSAVYGDYNQDDPDQSGDLEQMRTGADVLEKALQQYEILIQLTEDQVAKKHLGAP